MASEPKIGPNRGNAGKGRPKGAANKSTVAVKEMILAALDKAGGIEYLVAQSDANPAAFMTLVGKVLPLQIAGDAANPVHVATRIELFGVMPNDNR